MTVLEADDIFEQILIRLDVGDLIRCKSVCKSWRSLISETRFIENHLNRSYNNDRNGGIGNRRIILSSVPISLFEFEFGDWFLKEGNCHLLGSSNGLVCIFNFISAELLVANPLTRQVIKLKPPQLPSNVIRSKLCWDLCWGFGYDLSICDYKVIVGFTKCDGDNSTCFQVLNLKSNVWKVIGEVGYLYITRIATLCNGSFHWYMNDQNKNKVILSFHLSREEFFEIPQPDDPAYHTCVVVSSSRDPDISLGIMKECLCIFHLELIPQNLWVMNIYNVKQSWEKVRPDCEIKYEAIHCLRELRHDIPYDKSLSHDILLLKTFGFIAAPIFVQSLVSPRVHNYKREKRNKQPNRSIKLIKGDHLIRGSSARA